MIIVAVGVLYHNLRKSIINLIFPLKRLLSSTIYNPIKSSKVK